jgi:hypothetical protein
VLRFQTQRGGNPKGKGLLKDRERDRLIVEASGEKDAHWGSGAFARENGRFGSHPLHDDYGDEAKP